MTSADGTGRGGILRPLLGLAALVIIIAGARVAQPIIAPCLLAGFLAVICFPPLAWLNRKGLPGWLSLLIVVGGGAALVLLLVSLVGTSLTDFARKVPDYQQDLRAQVEQVVADLEARGVHIGELADQDAFDSRRLLGFVSTMVGTVGSLSSNVFVILLLFVFVLFEGAALPAKLDAMPGHSAERTDRLHRLLENVRHYLAIKTQMSFVTAVLVTILLAVLKVDFPILWGVLAFFLNYVPNIGSFIAAIPAVILAFVQLGTGSALFTASGYVVINVVIGNIVEPRIMGKGLGLSTLVVFLSLLFWGWVLGSVGMLLSVPLTMVAKICMESMDETRWLAILMGSGAPPRAAGKGAAS